MNKPNQNCPICKGAGYTGNDMFNPQNECDCSELQPFDGIIENYPCYVKNNADYFKIVDEDITIMASTFLREHYEISVMKSIFILKRASEYELTTKEDFEDEFNKAYEYLHNLALNESEQVLISATENA
jgi:hypothetical protein